MSTDRPTTDRPIESLTVNPVDIDVEALRRAQVEAIARAFYIPAHLLSARSFRGRIR